jgi:hypothetical protein
MFFCTLPRLLIGSPPIQFTTEPERDRITGVMGDNHTSRAERMLDAGHRRFRFGCPKCEATSLLGSGGYVHGMVVVQNLSLSERVIFARLYCPM